MLLHLCGVSHGLIDDSVARLAEVVVLPSLMVEESTRKWERKVALVAEVEAFRIWHAMDLEKVLPESCLSQLSRGAVQTPVERLWRSFWIFVDFVLRHYGAIIRRVLFSSTRLSLFRAVADALPFGVRDG